MANATIKITQLPNIGNNLSSNTLLPVVDTTGTAVTEKVTVGNVANFILTEAGNLLPEAFVAQIAYSVANAAQPNITSVGTLSVNTLKISGGTNGYVLQTDGTGNVTWTAPGGSGNGEVGGANTQVQFNDAGNFGGNTGFTFNKTTGVLAAPFADVSGVANTVGGGATVATKSVLNVDSTFGSNSSADPASAQAIRGRVTGSNLSKTRNYVAGVTGQYLVTGTNASEFINTGLLGVVGDQTTTANAAVVAYLDGDGGLTTAGSAYGVSMKNSTPGSGFDYGLDLQFINLNVAGTTTPFKQADIRFNNGVELVANTANNISINANVTAGNVLTSANVIANGAIESGTGFTTGGYLSVDGNTDLHNTVVTGNLSATGNITANNIGNIATINLTGSNSNVLYGNGVFAPASGGGNANTGNVTFDNINIIGTGNLNLQPDPANVSSYLDIFISSGPDLHLVASQSANLVLGKDNGANVMTSWDGNVYVQSWNQNTGTQGGVWTFNGDGSTIFPTLTVQRGDNPSGTITGQTLSFGDPSQEAIISTADGTVSNENSQRLVINPGQGYDYGEGGDIYLWAGRGGDGSGSGGDIKIRGGQGGANTTGGSGGSGGYIRIEAGDSATTGGSPGYVDINGGNSATAGGGYVEIYGGQGATVGGDANLKGGYGYTDRGGNVNIWGGGSANGQINEGNVNIQTGGYTWTFDPSGNLKLPDTTTITANVSITLEANDTGNITGLSVIGDAHANLYAHGNVKIVSDSSNTTPTWTFGTTGNLTLPANTVAINFANGSSAFGNIVATNLDGSSSNVLYGNGIFAAIPGPTVAQDITSNGAMSIMLYDGNIKYNNYATVEPSSGNIAGGNISANGNISGGNISATGNITANNLGNISSINIDGSNSNVLYGNGVFAAVAGGANTGNVTFSDINIIGTGNLKLQPDSANASAYLDIFLTGGPDIHIAGNGETVILGTDDYANVTVNVDGNVSIQAGNVSGTQTWNFGTDGNVTFPRDVVGNTDPYLKILGGPSPQILSEDASLAGPANLAIVTDYLNLSGSTGNKIILQADAGAIATDAAMVLSTNLADLGNVYSWTLDTTGNLSLPAGGSIYSEGFTPSGNPGNTITLNPHGSGSITNQKLLVYPTAGDGDHIHLTSGNLYQTELFLGSDNLFVKLSNTGNIVINSDDNAGNTAQWKFGIDGNLTASGNLIIAGNTNVFGTVSALIQPTDDKPLLAISSGANGAVSSVWVEDIGNVGTSNIAAVYANPTVGSGIVRIAVGQNGGNTGPNLWDFGNDGNLTLPANTFAINYANGTQVSLGGGNVTWAQLDDKNGNSGPTLIALGQNAGLDGQGNAAIAIGKNAGQGGQGASSITIGEDAGGNTTQGANAIAIGKSAGFDAQGFGAVAIGSSAGSNTQGGSAVALGDSAGQNSQGVYSVAIGYAAAQINQGASAVAVGFYAGQTNQGNNSIILNATGAALNQTVANTFTVAPVRNDTSNIAEVMFYNATSKEVTYGNTISVAGNVTANNFVGNGNTLSNVATKTSGSWTLAGGTNTVSISIPLNGTYAIWVNGNIPNGIITYTATAVITNTNVPVLGSQYAWYYALGNALVFTSIPNQFTGTVGSISTVNTYAGNTANVFTFGITNNSGNTAVVNYGYTKL